jgi:hypothetical protein
MVFTQTSLDLDGEFFKKLLVGHGGYVHMYVGKRRLPDAPNRFKPDRASWCQLCALRSELSLTAMFAREHSVRASPAAQV